MNLLFRDQAIFTHFYKTLEDCFQLMRTSVPIHTLKSPCVARTWRQRCVDRLPHCARTIPTDFCRIDTVVSWVRLLSSLFGAARLFAWICLREPAHSKTPTVGILDRYSRSARPHRCTLVCPTVLLIMKSLMNRFVLIIALPFTLFAGALQTVTLDVQNMTCAVCPITVRKALERVPGVTDAKVDFDKKTASISFDPDKASLAALTKATADAGYPSAVHK
jgi:mercuric ion binding protein